ncbi:hypothetical protein MMC06_000869 [Schaereria dolodes]|nr:hypothetical protein [Schaereria dolodes]
MSPSLDKRWQFGKRQSVFEPALPADAGGVAPTLPSESEPLQTQNPVSNASTRVVVAISVVFGVVFIGCALFVIYLCRLKIRAKEQGRYGRFGTGRGKGPTKFRGQPPRSEGRHGGLRGGYNDRPPDSSPYHNGGPSRSQGSLFRPPPIYCLPSTTGENYRPKPSPSSEQDTYLAPLEYCSRSPFRKSGALSDVISNNLSYPTNDSESSPYKPDYNTARRGSSYESIRGVDDWRGWRSDLDDLSPRSPESSIRGKSLGENSSRQYDSQDSPTPGYQQPPYNQYPPQGHSPYSQHQGYGVPPSDQFSQQGLPPQIGVYGQNPGSIARKAFDQSYQGLAQQQQQSFPGQAPYVAQSQTPYGASGIIPTPPSPGYGPNSTPPDDATTAADTLFNAMKRVGTNEATLINVLSHYPTQLIPHLKQTYFQRHNRSLEDHVASETSHNFKLTLLSILRGPLQQDVFLLNKALKGVGTNESLLNDVLIARSNTDMDAIKRAYFATYKRSLWADIKADLSAKTEQLFFMIVENPRHEDSIPYNPQADDARATELYHALEGRVGRYQETVCSILSNHNDAEIRSIALIYEQRYRTTLEAVVSKHFSGHMKAALLQMLKCACDRARLDAELLEQTMAGLGTRDDMLISRLVRVHWNREHMEQVKRAYAAHHKQKQLSARIRDETSGKDARDEAVEEGLDESLDPRILEIWTAWFWLQHVTLAEPQQKVPSRLWVSCTAFAA